MPSRRSFIKIASGSLAATGLSASFLQTFAGSNNMSATDFKLRFAVASDGHYGEPKTDYKTTHTNIINWLNQEHKSNHLDFVIFNGDLVHNNPALLKELKTDHLSKLNVPYYAIPGNHDLATPAQWKENFGYEDNFSFEKNGVAFVLANTSNTKGEYVCPDNNFIHAELEKFRDRKTVFVVLHIPPHRWLPEQDFFEDCPDTLSVIHQYANVKAVFHGHDHTLDSVFYTGSKLPHFFDAHYGGSWGTDYYGYRVVEISAGDEIHTHQVNASRNPVLNSNKI